MRDAELEGIPLVADVEQGRWAEPSIVVRHFDFGKDLSLSEIRVIQQLAKVAASKCDCELHFTLETLRFSITEKPVERKAESWPTKAECNAILAHYQRTGYQRPDIDDLLAPWRYLKWPINCNCS